jgi:hypothetical protein
MPAPAGEREAALAVIDRALAAHGAEQALAKFRNDMRKATGTLYVAERQVQFTTEVALSLPDKMRHVIDLDKGTRVVTVVNGERGWQFRGGAVVELGKESLAEWREGLYLWWVGSLVPLKKEGFDLAPIPEAQINGKPAVGVKVASKGRPDVKLYFDKGSGLLVKLATRVSLAGETVDKEILFSDYKDFDGVKLYTSLLETRDGKKESELRGMTHAVPAKVDESLFGKP